MSLTIAIDYDDTFTADPALWVLVIVAAQHRGHKVICVTGRKALPDFTRDPPLPASVPIVLAGAEFKRVAAGRAGYKVDIWIDDMPEMISSGGGILQWSQEG